MCTVQAYVVSYAAMPIAEDLLPPSPCRNAHMQHNPSGLRLCAGAQLAQLFIVTPQSVSLLCRYTYTMRPMPLAVT